MTNKRDCETCAHARPFGGPNDNRCEVWECEYINRQEAIEAYKERRDIVRCGECKRSGTDGENTFCMWLGALRKPTDFCSYGERRSE